MKKRHPLNQGIESGLERAKTDKEKLQELNKEPEPKTYTISRCKCGLEESGSNLKPASWGTHNPNYNKKSLKNY